MSNINPQKTKKNKADYKSAHNNISVVYLFKHPSKKIRLAGQEGNHSLGTKIDST